MINLRPDCLAFKDESGEATPVPVETLSLKLAGESLAFLDETVLNNAAYAVLHYLKTDLNQTSVSAGEFSALLQQALKGLGFDIKVEAAAPSAPRPRIAQADLHVLAHEKAHGLELLFFARLRDEMRRQLGQSPEILQFCGLRNCVKHIAGAKRWSARCQGLQDQIVDFLRACLGSEKGGHSCALVVR